MGSPIFFHQQILFHRKNFYFCFKMFPTFSETLYSVHAGIISMGYTVIVLKRVSMRSSGRVVLLAPIGRIGGNSNI